MSIIAFLIPIAVLLGGLGVLGFIWCLRNNQYDDLEGAAWRILQDDEDDGEDEKDDGRPGGKPVRPAPPSR